VALLDTRHTLQEKESTLGRLSSRLAEAEVALRTRTSGRVVVQHGQRQAHKLDFRENLNSNTNAADDNGDSNDDSFGFTPGGGAGGDEANGFVMTPESEVLGDVGDASRESGRLQEQETTGRNWNRNRSSYSLAEQGGELRRWMIRAREAEARIETITSTGGLQDASDGFATDRTADAGAGADADALAEERRLNQRLQVECSAMRIMVQRFLPIGPETENVDEDVLSGTGTGTGTSGIQGVDAAARLALDMNRRLG